MTRRPSRRTALRTAAAGVVGGLVVGAAAGYAGRPRSASDAEGPTDAVPAERHSVSVRDGVAALLDPALEPTLAASRALLDGASAVVVCGPADLAAGAPLATAAGVPLLLDGPGLAAELDRLGARTVLVPESTRLPVPAHLGDRQPLVADATSIARTPGLPARLSTGGLVVAAAPGATVPTALEPLLEVLGARRVALRGTDPRRTAADATALREDAAAAVLGVGALGEHFAQRVRTVRHAPELPGGGWLPFPGRRMVALYGHPRSAALGMLGEQSPAASARRVRGLAGQYARLLDEPVVPAFEIIATVATGSAGADGTYSQHTARSVLEPWLDAAQAAGVYVVLDLQPGRADFLTQARAYEALLRRPHVGLALDPEWRLGPGEKPLHRIGHVGVEEVNGVGQCLAPLVREHALPPKVLTLHQFRPDMVRDRARLDTTLDEVQWLVHADGQGGQGAKQATWDAVRRDLPAGVWLGWKNFVDEDAPMLTPAQTVDRVRPTPWFVSYQ